MTNFAVNPSIVDTVGKSSVEKSMISSINTLANSSADEIWSMIVEKATHLGFKLVAALLICIIGAFLIRLAKKFLRRVFLRHKADKAIESFTMSLVTALMWAILVIIAVGTLGVETTSLAALLAAGGMAIGMALSGTLQNFAGGLMILIFKPFKAGDYIEAQGYSGTVDDINITSTKITTADNKVIILPNGALQNGTINNYSKLPFRRVDLTVSVEYGSDVETVKSALKEIAAADSRVIGTADGAPGDTFVGISNLSNSSVDFAFKLWTRTGDYWGVFYDITEAVYKTLPQRGIEFPFQQITIHTN